MNHLRIGIVFGMVWISLGAGDSSLVYLYSRAYSLSAIMTKFRTPSKFWSFPLNHIPLPRKVFHVEGLPQHPLLHPLVYIVHSFPLPSPFQREANGFNSFYSSSSSAWPIRETSPSLESYKIQLSQWIFHECDKTSLTLYLLQNYDQFWKLICKISFWRTSAESI